jgi:hypothetical protein
MGCVTSTVLDWECADINAQVLKWMQEYQLPLMIKSPYIGGNVTPDMLEDVLTLGAAGAYAQKIDIKITVVHSPKEATIRISKKDDLDEDSALMTTREGSTTPPYDPPPA